jgi:EAL domain-containing protein (putative c-di-GMP-specific phosphodiesterase class I)
LAYLAQLRLDNIKIDRAFVAGMETPANRNILKAVINLGAVLGLKVVAEGVETREQLRVLRDLGCAEAQGYLFSRPVAAEMVPALLAEMPQRLAGIVKPDSSGRQSDR